MKIDMLALARHGASAADILRYNAALLAQARAVVNRLPYGANADFRYAQAVGPHLRHVLDHYIAFMTGLERKPEIRIAYDARDRDLALQSQPTLTLSRLAEMEKQLRVCADQPCPAWDMDTPVQVVALAGPEGEFELSTSSTLGRELLFLSSHTVHHFALVAHYCKAAGVDLGADFGKAPATVAFERMVEAHACA